MSDIQDDTEAVRDAIVEATRNPRYSKQDIGSFGSLTLTNVLHALSLENGDEEQTGSCDWVRHAVLFTFNEAETSLLKEACKDESFLVPALTIGLSVSSDGTPSLIDRSEYESIKAAYNAFMAEAEEENSLCPSCNEEKYADDDFCNGSSCANAKGEASLQCLAIFEGEERCEKPASHVNDPEDGLHVSRGANWTEEGVP